jgi:prolyl-tRNA synthetase
LSEHPDEDDRGRTAANTKEQTMRMSKLVGKRFKERPAAATVESHSLLLRGGYVRQVANGIYSLLPPGVRVAHKVEQIIREEMDAIDGQEVLMPVVLPRELWEESGRYQSVGPELLRMTDRTGHGLLLAMTHEEAVVHLTRNEIDSYRQLPFCVYQIQTKFRDEPRSRGGLIRVREFTMKDAYSYHTTLEDLLDYYGRMWRAYERIFARAGIAEVVVVESDTGMMGGTGAHEFMLLCEAGEDSIATCDSCGYLANREVVVGRIEAFPEEPLPLDKVHTPGQKTIEEVTGFLNQPLRKAAKVVFYRADSDGKPVMAMVRGDMEINEIKLGNLIGTVPEMADDQAIEAIGAVAGYASPIDVSAEKCRLLIDHTIQQSGNLICGANQVDYHYQNFNLDRDAPGIETVDIAQVRDGDGCPKCSGKIVLRRGIEVGNIFQLGTKYTKSMGMSVADEDGQEFHPIMGCYGIGVGRLFSSVMEERRDQYGPIWPVSIAPWQAHLCVLNIDQDEVWELAEDLYAQLQQAGVEVLFDDRGERAGFQFADADLLGVPVRLVLSKKGVAQGTVEVRRRESRDADHLPAAEVVAAVQKLIGEMFSEIEEQVPPLI